MSRFVEGAPPNASPTSGAAARDGQRRHALEPIAARTHLGFSDVLRALGQRVDQGEHVVRHALNSDLGALDARALIAVQAGIYHYTEAVELAGKLVDRATNAVRSVLQSATH